MTNQLELYTMLFMRQLFEACQRYSAIYSLSTWSCNSTLHLTQQHPCLTLGLHPCLKFLACPMLCSAALISHLRVPLSKLLFHFLLVLLSETAVVLTVAISQTSCLPYSWKVLILPPRLLIQCWFQGHCYLPSCVLHLCLKSTHYLNSLLDLFLLPMCPFFSHWTLPRVTLFTDIQHHLLG